MHQLPDGNVESFKNFLRVEPDLFHELVVRLIPHIQKDTNMRRALELGLKLAVALSYMASGDRYKSLSKEFRVAPNTIVIIAPKVCQVIHEELHEEYIKFPTTEEEWKKATKGFLDSWNSRHTFGAIDSKYVAIQAPAHSGTTFHNYKGYFSIVVLVVVDSQYKFLYVDVGANGSYPDTGILKDNELHSAVEERATASPIPEPLLYDNHPCATRNITKPERLFNYRLFRARRIVENAFGILAHRFSSLLTTKLQKLDNVGLLLPPQLANRQKTGDHQKKN